MNFVADLGVVVDVAVEYVAIDGGGVVAGVARTRIRTEDECKSVVEVVEKIRFVDES